MQPANKTIVQVHQPKLKPSFTNIGYGNPRYNSMVVCPDDSVIISCGASLRRVDLLKNEVLFNKQVGYSQIFQIMANEKWIMIVNFQGLVSLLNKNTLQVEKQFYLGGKQIRHSSFTNDYIAVSCELNDQIKEPSLQIYSISDIVASEGIRINIKPMVKKFGHYYYPELHGNSLVFIQFNDPNPKGRSRTQTVLNKKLPIKHRILKLNLKDSSEDIKQVYNINIEGEILCASQNYSTNQIFYLHQSKQLTILNLEGEKCLETQLKATSAPHCIESYRNGILFASESSQLAYLQWKEEIKIQAIKTKSKGLTTNYCIKAAETNKDNFIFFNEYGLQYYDSANAKSYSQNCFDITNCGVSFNKDSSKFSVADFGGNVFIFTTNEQNIFPQPLSKVTIGIPVRSLTWCHDNDKIIIGCVGGYLFCWDGVSQQANLIAQTNDHTVNIVRYFQGFVIFGTSDGFVHIMNTKSLEQLYRFQSHTPIHYQNQKDRQLFGSMKNYSQIWSIVAYPSQKQNIFNIVTCSQDQTQKVYLIQISQTGAFSQTQLHHLVGHSLAVTSIDWKVMGKGLGPIYVSCSDDKIVRFRDPQNMFEILHELETSTIKQWHTLTYLSLEPDGHRVAIGSQNGYLFIFDIHSKQLMFGQKIHLGGIEGLDWVNGKLITCSSDLCISIIRL